jgi:hypothetical protein
MSPLINIPMTDEEKLQRRKELLQMPTVSVANASGSITRKTDGFLFDNLEINDGQYADSLLYADILTECHDLSAWWAYAQNTPDKMLPNTVILYQMMHRLYTLRNDRQTRDVRTEALDMLRNDQNSHVYNGTMIIYNKDGLEATIQHLQPDGVLPEKTIKNIQLIIPEFDKGKNSNRAYIRLAEERPESKLEKIIPPLLQALPLLQGLFGAHAEETITVMQYVTSRKNNNLTEVWLSVPAIQNRCPYTLTSYINRYNNLMIDAATSLHNTCRARAIKVEAIR